ncbi:MAG: hypothetical protein DDT32_01620 [Syntrophomonadaceae bacterium]|nr:hypothetical protein [Bacillota bacterium]MBT9147854.1 hypothetical protein [Bacillota bacterium]
MLVALTAALYVAILIPFKGIPLIPGFTEIRPAQIIAATFPLFFGPAGAWGLAIGNLIGDMFGTLTLGSIFGFIGNLFIGVVIYKLWRTFGKEAIVKSGKDYAIYALCVICSAFLCGAIIAWGLEVLGLLPFAALGTIIPLNNTIMPLVLGPVLLALLYPRIKKWGLRWQDIMDEKDISKQKLVIPARIMVAVGSIGAIVVGLAISTGVYGAALAGFGVGTVGVGVIVAVAPFILLAVTPLLFLI